MRTISTAQSIVLANPDRSTHIRVKVYDGSSWIDLTDHRDRDWLVSVDYGETQDGRIADASFTVWLADHDLNMSPLMTSSLCNDPNVVLAVGNDVLIDAAIMPLDTTPASGDWMNVFDGQIDGWTIGKDTITCKCYDQGQQLADAFIEKEYEYGDGSDDVSVVMQDILDDWPNTPDGANVTLWSPSGVAGTEFGDGTGGTDDDRPGWAISKYRQKRQPIFDALQTLAKMIGYDVRYRWQADSAAFELVMWIPDRDASGGSVYTFGLDEILNVSSVSLTRRGIRNVIRVVYTDGETNNRASVTGTTAASVAKYGRRWCELAEGESSQIDTSAEATILAEAASDDMSEPTATVSITVPYFPWAELQDLYTVTANDNQFEANQTLAVVGIRHRVAKGSCTTNLTLEGNPRVGKTTYLRKQHQREDRVYDNTNIVTITAETNLCPNGGTGQYDAQ